MPLLLPTFCLIVIPSVYCTASHIKNHCVAVIYNPASSLTLVLKAMVASECSEIKVPSLPSELQQESLKIILRVF